MTSKSNITPADSGSRPFPEPEHIHRRPKKADFEGKTIKRFIRTADNIWRFQFTDGTAFAVQSENFGPYGLACMELCEVCAKPEPRRREQTP